MSIQDFPSQGLEVAFRVLLDGEDVRVFAFVPVDSAQELPEDLHYWTQLRVAHLFPPIQEKPEEEEDDDPNVVKVGLYCCSPIAAGYQAQFAYFRIDTVDSHKLEYDPVLLPN